MSLEVLSAAAVTKNGIIQPQVHESELKRCAGIWGASEEVMITLTNQRLLLMSPEENQTRELSLTAVMKAKPQKGSMFGGKKEPTLVIKMTDETKYELTFKQQPNSIYTDFQERDDVCRLINEYLKIRNPI